MSLEIRSMRELTIAEVTGGIKIPTSVFGNRSITLDVFLEWCTKNGIPSDTKISELEDLLVAELRLLPTYETLEDYTTFEDTAEMIAQAQLVGEEVDLSIYARNSAVDDLLLDKVDKVAGKGLSEADFTNTEKLKLEGIEDGAQVNPDQAFYDDLLTPLSDRLSSVESDLPTKATKQEFQSTVNTLTNNISQKINKVEADGKFALASQLSSLLPIVDFDLYKVQQTQTLADKADKTQLTPLATKQYVDDAIAALPPIIAPTIQINGVHFAMGDMKFALMTY